MKQPSSCGTPLIFRAQENIGPINRGHEICHSGSNARSFYTELRKPEVSKYEKVIKDNVSDISNKVSDQNI